MIYLDDRHVSFYQQFEILLTLHVKSLIPNFICPVYLALHIKETGTKMHKVSKLRDLMLNSNQITMLKGILNLTAKMKGLIERNLDVQSDTGMVTGLAMENRLF